MLVNLNEIFKIANERKIAIGAFNVPNVSMLRTVISAAESLKLPVIIQHTEGHNHLITMDEIAPIMIHYAKKSSVPVCVHLDHGTSVSDCNKAIDLGFTSVMYDGSALDFGGNISGTQKVVSLAKRNNVTVEAELGQMLNSTIGGGEGVEYTSSDYHYTEVSDAIEFVDKTKVDCLAVAIGTMHGIYLEKPKLNLARIKEIDEAIHVPIVLHGGSGLEVHEYQTAVKNGVRKINYYTYMNKTGGEEIALLIKQNKEYEFFDELLLHAEKAMFENIQYFMKIISNQA